MKKIVIGALAALLAGVGVASFTLYKNQSQKQEK
jgi:uncharacterized protein YxeA